MTKKFVDPYDKMSDENFDSYVASLLERKKEKSVSISVRMPSKLILGIRELAEDIGIPYQTLMKGLLERDVERLQAGRSKKNTHRTGAK